MKVEAINIKESQVQHLNADNVGCKIELSLSEAVSIMHSLMRTSEKGDNLTVSMELEDKLAEFTNNYRYEI